MRASIIGCWLSASLLSPFSALGADAPIALVDPKTTAATAERATAAPAEEIVKRLTGGAVLHIAPGTRFEMGRPMKIPLGPPGSADTLAQTLTFYGGRLDVEIPKAKVPTTALLIKAPHNVSAVAKGGHSVAVLEHNRATFAAVDADMLSASGNDWRTLRAGLVRSFTGAVSTPEEHAVPGVPALSVARPIVLALDGRSSSADVRVGGVAQAQKYEVSVFRVAEQGRELIRRVDFKDGGGSVDGLGPGHYEFSARAVDAAGISGPEAEARSLRVVGAELPPGARVEQGAVLLGQHARVALIGAEGLEASYGRASHFVPAPSSVGLARGESTTLRLREPGAAEEVQFALEPRALHSEISMGPKLARWPADRVEITLRVFDAHDRPVSESVKVVPEVLADVEPLDVTWERSGNQLHTVVPAQKGSGPWVIRVEVKDEFGDACGRDFLEVAGSPPAAPAPR